MVDRKPIYLKWIKDSLSRLLSLQDRRVYSPTKGCFFYPLWREKERYTNARWQEAVLSLAWVWQRGEDDELKERVTEGIDFWCRIQNRDGSFPEYCRDDRSFSATAFSTYAVLRAMEIIGNKKRWLGSLDRAGRWLSGNNERYLTNQEAMAGLTLLELYLSLNKAEFLRAAEKKIEPVLNSFLKEGFFREKNGFDLGYSSLTLSILGNYYLKRRDEKIRRVARDCILLMDKFIYPDGSFGGTYNSRQIGWVILDGLEIFSPEIIEAQIVLSRLFRGHLSGIGDLAHLPGSRHLCTDLYRLCQAYDHANAELVEESKSYERGEELLPQLGLEIIRTDRYIAITDLDNCHLYSFWLTDGLKIFFKSRSNEKGHLLNLFRPLGIHRFRGLRRLSMLVRTPETNCRYSFSNEDIKVRIDRGREELLFAYSRPYIIEKDKSRTILKGERDLFSIYPNDYLKIEDMGRISVEDSIFYGDKALGFLRIRIGNPSRRPLEYVLRFS